MSSEDKLSKAVRIDDIKTFIGFSAILVSVIFFGSQLQSTSARNTEELREARQDIKTINEKVNDLALDVNEVKAVLKGAQGRGEITRAQTFKDYVAPNLVSISPVPQSVVYNTFVADPTPSPEPTPTPTEATICLLTNCL